MSGTSYSLINQSNYAPSSLIFTAGVTVLEIYPSSPVFNQLCIFTRWKINGNFAPDLHPSSFTVTVSFYFNNQSFKDVQNVNPNSDSNLGLNWSNNATLAKIPPRNYLHSSALSIHCRITHKQNTGISLEQI